MTRPVTLTPIEAIRESEERAQRAAELFESDLGYEDIAVKLFERSNGILVAHVRDLLRLAGASSRNSIRAE